MGVIKKPTRFAHSEGHLDICYDDDGEHIITCGTDGDVRIYEGFEDDEPLTHRVGESVHAVAYKNYRFYTASDDHSIQGFIFKEGQPDGIITRFTAPVTHMCFSKDGRKLLAGSSDFTVRLVDVASSGYKVLTEHQAPVLSVALSPDGSFAASSSCDGTVKVCEAEGGKVVKTIQGLPKCNDFTLSKTLCRLCWDKQGKYLIIPVEKEIKVYNCQSWDEVFTLKDDTITENVSIVVLSPCGNYLAAACRDGKMFIWDFKKKMCITREKHDKGLTITGLVWNPKKKQEIAYCDTNGNLGLLENVLPENNTANSLNKGEEMTADQLADLFDEDDDDMLVEATNPTSKTAKDESDDDMPTMTPGTRRTTRIMDDDDDDDVSRDTDMEKNDPRKDLFEDLASDAGTDVAAATTHKLAAAPVPQGWWPTAMQPSFQPGSSPDHLSHRYMVWNSTGIILQYNTDEENSVNIEFHDAATHHPIHITNTLGHTMADMSSQAVVLACPSDEESSSKLVCMVLSAWDNSKEWTVPMPDGEEIEAITVSDSWAAAATSSRLVRLFSLGGIQQEVLCLPGPVVAMAAHTNQLLIAYHRGMAIPGDQCLGVQVFYVAGKKRVALKGELPLTAKSTLTYLGFSSEGTPFCADSLGVVRMINRAFGNSWIQVANTKGHTKGHSDNYFIVGIHENPQQLRAVLCKGSKYPQTLPRPTVALLPFKIPLCELVTDKGSFEESFWRSRLFGQHMDWWETQGYEVDDNDKSQQAMPQQEALMKLFALSCKSEREYRAAELCRMMPSHHTVQLAIKYASRLRMIQLAQRLNEVAREKMEEELLKAQTGVAADDEEEDNEDFRTHLEAVHSHVETEWSHTKASPRSSAAVGEHQPVAVRDEEEDGDEEGADIYEEIEDGDDTEEKRPSAPMLKLGGKKDQTAKSISLSQTRKNPFKVNLQKNVTHGKGASVFDDMNKPKPFARGSVQSRSPLDKPVTIKRRPKGESKKVQGIGKVFGKKKDEQPEASKDDDVENIPERDSSRTGFQLWYDTTQEELREEHPDLSDPDLVVMGAKQFKDLPPDEKKEWNDKAKQGAAENETKKRKRDEADSEETETKVTKMNLSDTSTKKAVLSENTSSKLSGFAFGKS